MPNSFPPTRHVKPPALRAVDALRAGLGRYVYGFGVMAMGLTGLVWGDFLTGQPVPNDFPHRTALAYTAAAFLLCVGAVIQWRKSAPTGAAALAAYYVLIVLLLMNGPVLLAHFKEFGTYEDLAEQFAITAGALIVFASTARIRAPLAARLTLVAQLIFAVCALIFGGAHFLYMNLTAPLVPTWLPPSQVFWGYLTGAAFLAVGVAILARIQARLATLLLTLMLGTFTLLVHIRMLFADHKSQMNWTELAINLAILGASWVLADSFARPNS